MHTRTVAGADKRQILLDEANAGRRILDEIRARRATRERFDAQRARAREEIQYASVRQQRTDDAHPRLAYSIGGRAHPAALRRLEPAATPLAGADSHGPPGAAGRQPAPKPRPAVIWVD